MTTNTEQLLRKRFEAAWRKKYGNRLYCESAWEGYQMAALTQPAQAGEAVAWLCNWPGQGKETWHHVYINESDAIDRKRNSGGEIVPLYTAPPASQEQADTQAVDKAWGRFAIAMGDAPGSPYPGMAKAFEEHFGQSWVDKDWRNEQSVWAAAWRKAWDAHAHQSAQRASQEQAQQPLKSFAPLFERNRAGIEQAKAEMDAEAQQPSGGEVSDELIDRIADDYEDDCGRIRMDKVFDFARAILTLATKPEPMTWQPIETAPKDGAEFLGWRHGRIATARLVPRDDCEMWCFGGESFAFESFPALRPTHWMPLPDAASITSTSTSTKGPQ